jgi:hypothetical protein
VLKRPHDQTSEVFNEISIGSNPLRTAQIRYGAIATQTSEVFAATPSAGSGYRTQWVDLKHVAIDRFLQSRQKPAGG